MKRNTLKFLVVACSLSASSLMAAAASSDAASAPAEAKVRAEQPQRVRVVVEGVVLQQQEDKSAAAAPAAAVAQADKKEDKKEVQQPASADKKEEKKGESAAKSDDSKDSKKDASAPTQGLVAGLASQAFNGVGTVTVGVTQWITPNPVYKFVSRNLPATAKDLIDNNQSSVTRSFFRAGVGSLFLGSVVAAEYGVYRAVTSLYRQVMGKCSCHHHEAKKA